MFNAIQFQNNNQYQSMGMFSSHFNIFEFLGRQKTTSLVNVDLNFHCRIIELMCSANCNVLRAPGALHCTALHWRAVPEQCSSLAVTAILSIFNSITLSLNQ